MHDLNTINRLNAQAHAKGITSARAAGKYVMAHYCGLTLVAFEVLTEEQAGRAVMQSELPGDRAVLLYPFPADSAEAAAARGRDQSEDAPAFRKYQEPAAPAMSTLRAIDLVEGVEEADGDDVAAAWQHLIDSRLAWKLQGSYGRAADALIARGICSPPPV